MSDAQPRDASGYAAPFDQGFIVEIHPGRRFECRYVPLTDQLVLGRVPNELYRFVHFEEFTPGDHKRDKDGNLTPKNDFEKAAEQKSAWEHYARLAARAMVWPRLDIKTEQGDPANGILALRHLTFVELYEIAWRAVREVLPAPATFPVGGSDDDDAEPGAPGGAVASEPGAQEGTAPAAAEGADGAQSHATS